MLLFRIFSTAFRLQWSQKTDYVLCFVADSVMSPFFLLFLRAIIDLGI